MKLVTPNARLIARPEVDWANIAAYLDEVGGSAWFDRVSMENDSQALMEFAGRLCYKSWAPGLNPNVTRVREDSDEYLANIVSTAHGSVIEHANFSFIISNVSRVFTHELVRHRAGCAYSQESLRFVRLDDIGFWFPKWASADTELYCRSLEVLDTLEKHQLWMADHFGLDEEGVPFSEKKAKTSFMRRFAPEGLATAIVFTANVRSMRHVIEMRTAEGAEEEIRLVFGQIAEIMRDEVPALFADYTVKDGAWIPGTRKA